MLFSKLSFLAQFEEEERKYLNSVTAGESSTGDYVREFLTKAWQEISKILDPIMLYGISSVIVVCVVIYFCSHDRKAVSHGIKWFFAYVVYCFLRRFALCP